MMPCVYCTATQDKYGVITHQNSCSMFHGAEEWGFFDKQPTKKEFKKYAAQIKAFFKNPSKILTHSGRNYETLDRHKLPDGRWRDTKRIVENGVLVGESTVTWPKDCILGDPDHG